MLVLYTKQKGTLAHILSFCPVVLTEHRLTWSHNSVLKHLFKELKWFYAGIPFQIRAYLPMENYDEKIATIPDYFVCQSQRPDTTIINLETHQISMLELTCFFDKAESFEDARPRKSERYRLLIDELRTNGLSAKSLPINYWHRRQLSTIHRGRTQKCFQTQ